MMEILEFLAINAPSGVGASYHAGVTPTYHAKV